MIQPCCAHTLNSGLASFLLGTVPALIVLFAVGIDSFFTGRSVTETVLNRTFYLLNLIILPLLFLLGLIFSIVGIYKKNTKMLFPIMGFIFNLTGLILMAVVWIIILFFIGLLAIVGPVPVR